MCVDPAKLLVLGQVTRLNDLFNLFIQPEGHTEEVQLAMRSTSLGRLIVFEGIDASGKNTQSRMLFEYLKAGGHKAEYISFPDYSTPIGKEIMNFLSKQSEYNLEARHLLYAANRYEHKEQIEEWLRRGEHVIANRYSESNLAYGVANGLSHKWLESVESRMPKADYILFLKVTPEVSLARKPMRDRYEGDLNFLKRVSDVYEALIEHGRWFKIDGERPRESVAYEVSKLVSALLEEKGEKILSHVSHGNSGGKE
jgi:dTMP kinase